MSERADGSVDFVQQKPLTRTKTPTYASKVNTRLLLLVLLYHIINHFKAVLRRQRLLQVDRAHLIQMAILDRIGQREAALVANRAAAQHEQA